MRKPTGSWEMLSPTQTKPSNKSRHRTESKLVELPLKAHIQSSLNPTHSLIDGTGLLSTKVS